MIHHDSIRDHIPFLLLAAYPDRVGKRSATGSNRIRLGDGSTVELEEKSCAYLPRGKKASERELIVAARCQGLSGRGRSASVRCASAAIIEEDDLSTVFPDGVQEREELRYDPAKDKVTAERTRRFGNLVLSYQQSEPHDRNTAAALLAEHLAERFASVLAEQWPETHHFMSRWAWLRQQRPELEWPDPKDPSVVHDICQAWAADQLSLKGLPDPLAFAQTALGWDQLATLDQLAPASLTLSRGRGNRQKTITYPEDGSTPSLSAFIQDWFGTTRHPSINDGRTPLKLDLLAPNRRTAQITEDLPGFFAGYYALVRKDLKGRYPKHDWPEKPGSTQ